MYYTVYPAWMEVSAALSRRRRQAQAEREAAHHREELSLATLELSEARSPQSVPGRFRPPLEFCLGTLLLRRVVHHAENAN